MPLDIVIAPLDLWSEMHECDIKLKMRVRRMKEGREFRGGFAAFSSCFPGLCEGRLNSIQPMSLSQPCLPVANLGPTRILPHLYLGSQKDVLNKDLMAQNGITYVLNASNTCPQPDFICESHFMRVPVDDSYCEKLLPWLERSNLFIEKAKLSNCRVIVHCLAGISRSATIAIAYIMKTMGLSSDEAYRFVKDRRPSISPNFNFLGQLLEFEKGLKLLKALTSGQGKEENLDLEERESKSQDARLETEPPEKKPEPLKTDSIVATSPASLQQGLSSLHLSAERILDTSQLKRSFSLNIRSAYTSGPCPRAVATSENVPKLCELNCSDSFCLLSPAGGGQGSESPHGGETRARQRRKGKHSDCAPNSPALLTVHKGPSLEESLQASLLLNLPVAGSSSVWTQHRTMVQSTSQGAPMGHDSWFFPAAVSPFGPAVQLREKPRGARGDSRGSWHEGGPSATAANKQFHRRSCQMEFEDGISETHSCEELGKLGKQPSFSGSMDIIEVS